MEVENFCTKLPKGTRLRQIWSNILFGVCGSDVVLTLYGGEKKVRENRHWKSRVAYNTTLQLRRRDKFTVNMCGSMGLRGTQLTHWVSDS